MQYRMDRGLFNNFVYILLLLLVGILLLLNIDFVPEKELRIKSEQGEMELAFWYPESSPPLKLKNAWLGFPDQLLTPSEVENSVQSATVVYFPNVWQPPGPRRHVMTYTLLLKHVPADIKLGLKIPEIKNSFRLFLNEREIAVGGFPSNDISHSKGYFGDRIVGLGVLPSEVRLTLQVSNFGHSRGGVHGAPVLATQEHWTHYYRFNILVECVVISLALIAGFLMLFEYYLVPEHKELLWISLFSLVLAGYIGTSGLGSFATLMPRFPWELGVRLEYIGFATAIPLFLNWLASLYKQDIQYRVIRWCSWVSLALTFYIMLTPSNLFTGLLYGLLAYMCACIALAAWMMFTLFLRNRSGIRVLVFGASALMIGIFHDLMIFLGVIQGAGVLGSCVLVFLVSQLGFLTFYRTQEQIRILDLNSSLQDTAVALKTQIDVRSHDLEFRTAELEQCKEKCQHLQNEDELTGLMNRHHFLDLIERRLERMPRLGFSLIIVDIDHYKLIVDLHGREFAESILQKMAKILEIACDNHFDRIPARYGGDEFILWLGRSDPKEAEAIARDIRLSAARMQITLPSSAALSSPALSNTTLSNASHEQYHFTVSTGVASTDGAMRDLNALLAKAADSVHLNRMRRSKKRSNIQKARK